MIDVQKIDIEEAPAKNPEETQHLLSLFDYLFEIDKWNFSSKTLEPWYAELWEMLTSGKKEAKKVSDEIASPAEAWEAALSLLTVQADRHLFLLNEKEGILHRVFLKQPSKAAISFLTDYLSRDRDLALREIDSFQGQIALEEDLTEAEQILLLRMMIYMMMADQRLAESETRLLRDQVQRLAFTEEAQELLVNELGKPTFRLEELNQVDTPAKRNLFYKNATLVVRKDRIVVEEEEKALGEMIQVLGLKQNAAKRIDRLVELALYALGTEGLLDEISHIGVDVLDGLLMTRTGASGIGRELQRSLYLLLRKYQDRAAGIIRDSEMKISAVFTKAIDALEHVERKTEIEQTVTDLQNAFQEYAQDDLRIQVENWHRDLLEETEAFHSRFDQHANEAETPFAKKIRTTESSAVKFVGGITGVGGEIAAAALSVPILTGGWLFATIALGPVMAISLIVFAPVAALGWLVGKKALVRQKAASVRDELMKCEKKLLRDPKSGLAPTLDRIFDGALRSVRGSVKERFDRLSD